MQSTRSEQIQYFAELVKHCVNKRQKKERLKNCNGEIASGIALLACRFTNRGMGMGSP